MTLSKLAKLANVSVSTASKAFSMSDNVSPETREHIFNVAKEHGVFRHFYNAKYSKPVIAVICPEIASRFYSEILDMLRKTLEDSGCEMCISATEFSTEKALELVTYFDRYASVDGIILFGVSLDMPEGITIPAVSLLSAVSGIPNIRADAVGIYEDILSDYKDKTVCVIGEKRTTLIIANIRKALRNVGIAETEENIVITDERFEKGGYIAMTRLLQKGISPDLLLCAYDYMALGAIRAIADNNATCPKIVGFNNIPECDYTVPRISSIGYDAAKLCETAASSIIDLIDGNPVGNTSFRLSYFERNL